jgi:hypothetical protein
VHLTYPDVYGQIISSAGILRGENFVIRDHDSGYLGYPDVAYDTNNQCYLAVWENKAENHIIVIASKRTTPRRGQPPT